MILVTGGTGLVGAHLLYKLVCNNKTVRAIYRSKHKQLNTQNVFASYTSDYEAIYSRIEWIQADILDIPSLQNAFNGVSYVYHCAAFVSFEPNKYQLLRKTNIEGTANIVNLCIDNNIKKLCYVSSIATLDKPLDNNTINEDSVWNTEEDHSVYAITKYGAEMEVWRATQEGLNAVIVNPGVIMGAGIWKYGSGSLFKRAHKGLNYYTSGTVGLIAVEDVATIMIALMQEPITNERFVLVAENWTYKQFLETISIAVNATPPLKMANTTWLNWAWKLDWLRHKLTGKRRQLTKHLAKSLETAHLYSNEKIKKTLNYSFKDINNTIIKVGGQFLKQD